MQTKGGSYEKGNMQAPKYRGGIQCEQAKDGQKKNEKWVENLRGEKERDGCLPNCFKGEIAQGGVLKMAQAVWGGDARLGRASRGEKKRKFRQWIIGGGGGTEKGD